MKCVALGGEVSLGVSGLALHNDYEVLSSLGRSCLNKTLVTLTPWPEQGLGQQPTKRP